MSLLILARSTKKHKSDAIPSTQVIEETMVMKMKRNVVSYKDAITGGNEEDNDSEDSSANSESESEGESDSEHESEDQADAVEDPLCPEVKISKGEYKCACKQWKHAVIVKLLGKKVGLKFIQSRLDKLWKPLMDGVRLVQVGIYFLYT
ncbi:hypothetical protein SESBI_50540 [Sesbania bispinosa]|nr:hypothetical protein SESBI_50540 [Sesbania bispinosa]